MEFYINWRLKILDQFSNFLWFLIFYLCLSVLLFGRCPHICLLTHLYFIFISTVAFLISKSTFLFRECSFLYHALFIFWIQYLLSSIESLQFSHCLCYFWVPSDCSVIYFGGFSPQFSVILSCLFISKKNLLKKLIAGSLYRVWWWWKHLQG